jgi:hypothetical protein
MAIDKRSINNIVNHAQVSEKAIERYLVEQVKSWGGICLKYSSLNVVGYPDRLVMLPGGFVMWVELKSKGKKPTKLQTIRRKELESIGQYVATIDSKAGVDEIKKTYNLWRSKYEV